MHQIRHLKRNIYLDINGSLTKSHDKESLLSLVTNLFCEIIKVEELINEWFVLNVEWFVIYELRTIRLLHNFPPLKCWNLLFTGFILSFFLNKKKRSKILKKWETKNPLARPVWKKNEIREEIYFFSWNVWLFWWFSSASKKFLFIRYAVTVFFYCFFLMFLRNTQLC